MWTVRSVQLPQRRSPELTEHEDIYTLSVVQQLEIIKFSTSGMKTGITVANCASVVVRRGSGVLHSPRDDQVRFLVLLPSSSA